VIYAHDRCLFLWSILAYTQGTAVGYVRPSVQQLSFHPAGRNSLPQQTTGRLGLAADNASTLGRPDRRRSICDSLCIVLTMPYSPSVAT